MVRVAVTLCLVLTTLAGHSLCCCALANSVKLPESSVAAPRKAVKSCCHSDGLHRDGHGKQTPDPGKPSKCPCEHRKHQAMAPPASGQQGVDVVAQLMLVDALGLDCSAPNGLDPFLVLSVERSTHPRNALLAGRDLLAAYSILRC